MTQFMECFRTEFLKDPTPISVLLSVAPEQSIFPGSHLDVHLKPKGKFRGGGPSGAIVHFTASGDNLKNILADAGLRELCFNLIGKQGEFYQTHTLQEWGGHAGISEYKGLGNGVSQYCVGIEIVSAGIVTPMDSRNPEKGGLTYFGKVAEFVRYIPVEADNQHPGLYEAYTFKQEATLFTYLLWLKARDPKNFHFQWVLGHDEVCIPQGRKVDPGGALSVTMPRLRQILTECYDAFEKEFHK